MPLPRANGVTLYYELHGDSDAPPLALFVGLGGNLAMWDAELIGDLTLDVE